MDDLFVGRFDLLIDRLLRFDDRLEIALRRVEFLLQPFDLMFPRGEFRIDRNPTELASLGSTHCRNCVIHRWMELKYV